MKKIFKVISIFMIAVLLTGCVKYHYNIEITEDKKMKMELIVAVSSALQESGSVESDEEDEEAEKKLKEEGWIVEDYKDDTYTGKKYTKTFDNIDKVSTEKEQEVDLNKLVNEGETSEYFFYKRVENGKEIYKAVFESDTSEAGQGEETTDETNKSVTRSETEIEEDDLLEEDGTDTLRSDGDSVQVIESADGTVTITTGSDTDTDDDDWDTEDSSDSTMDDSQMAALEKQMMSTMDIKVNVIAPNIISNNATSVDGNKMTWDLTKTEEKSTIEFEFAIPIKNQIPIIPIAIGAGAGLLLIVIIIVAVSLGKKKKNEVVPAANGVEVPAQPVTPAVPEQASTVTETPVTPEVASTVEAAPVALETPVVAETPVEPVVTPEPVVETPAIEQAPEAPATDNTIQQ